MQTFFQQSRLSTSPISGWAFPSLWSAERLYSFSSTALSNLFAKQSAPAEPARQLAESAAPRQIFSNPPPSLNPTCAEPPVVVSPPRAQAPDMHAQQQIPSTSAPVTNKKRPVGLGLGLPSTVRAASTSVSTSPSPSTSATTNPAPRAKKGSAGLGLGLPSARGTAIAAAAARVPTRPRTVSPLNFLRPSRFPKRPLYAIPEMPGEESPAGSRVPSLGRNGASMPSRAPSVSLRRPTSRPRRIISSAPSQLAPSSARLQAASSNCLLF
ncbi:hypothetical protein HDZ31DRAFT_59568 [Schizophyllum fasciatum]